MNAGAFLSTDTIVALASAPGRGALAVVRLSGPQSHAVAARVVRPWPLPERRATLAIVHHPETGERVDQAVVVAFDGERSYTGEPAVELTTHGGLVAPVAVVAALVAAGARPAEPGEFTRRAVLHGKLDLLQAEAVADIVDARSSSAHRRALAQLDGALSRRVLALRDAIIGVEALIAYDIDFPEEDDGPVPRERVFAAAAAARQAVEALLATAPVGELVREGALVVLAGPPNAGKSSLFNALLGRARAIVTPVPGTTRDALEATLDGDSFPLRLVDTAGLRDTSDVVERLGVEVSERYLADAHLVLACGETPDDLEMTARRAAAITSAPVLRVWTKSDLRSDVTSRGAPRPNPQAPHPISVSAERGDGLRELLVAAERSIAERWGTPPVDAPVLTRERHRHALTVARDELLEFERAWQQWSLPAPVAAVHIRAAAGALEELIGAVDVEDVLDRVFASFCVGK